MDWKKCSKWKLQCNQQCPFLNIVSLKKKQNGNTFTTSLCIIKDVGKEITKPINSNNLLLQNKCNKLANINPKLLNANLKRYNLFNIYLDKIRGRERQRRKVVNLHHVKYYDEYIYMFNLEALVHYAKYKLKKWKQKVKKEQEKKQDQQNSTHFFFYIFLRYIVILNDFFLYKKEKKCNDVFQKIFLPIIPSKYYTAQNKRENNNYNTNFFIKGWKIVNILSQVDFFSELKKTNLLTSLSAFNKLEVKTSLGKSEHQISVLQKKKENTKSWECEKKETILRNDQKKEISANKEKKKKNDGVNNHTQEEKCTHVKEIIKIENYGNYMHENNEEDSLLHYIMTANVKEPIISANGGSNFLHNLKLFDTIYEIQNIDTYFYFGDKEKKKSSFEKEKKMCSENKMENLICKKSFCDTWEESTHFLKLTRGFFFFLKHFMKYVNEDTAVKMFVDSFKLLKDIGNEKEKVMSYFSKEIYNRFNVLKYISNKNLAYILTVCNTTVGAENKALLNYAKKEIIKKGTESESAPSYNIKGNKRRHFDIYKITPSHLENIIYAFSKNKCKNKKLYLLFSKIIKTKYQGFSCIVTINILHSFTVLNYEMFIFPYLYEQIKSFDILTFVTCTSKNILKLIHTLMMIETNHQNKKVLTKKEVVHELAANKSNTLTESITYITLFVALLYEQNRWKENELNEKMIKHLYKTSIRLHLFDVKNKMEWKMLKNILSKNHQHFSDTQVPRENTLFFSFLKENIDKINFHKLIWTLLSYNSYLHKHNSLHMKNVKRKFI